MSASFAGNPNSFLQEDYVIPSDPEQMSVRLRQYLNDLSASINTRDIGIYVSQETICGQLWVPSISNSAFSNVVYRQVIRKVVATGTLATGANTIAHNITVTANTHFTRIYGVIENAGTLYVPVPNNATTVTVDATNININIPGAYNNYSGNVVLEWVATS
jgi:hypothetical protein